LPNPAGFEKMDEHPFHESRVDPHDDHRLAMSLAVVELKVPGVRIQNPACVGKSFPRFWDLWKGFTGESGMGIK